jgi:hypothetical protein
VSLVLEILHLVPINYCYRELDKLADDIDRASRQGKIPAFFNSADDSSAVTGHVQTLDSIVGDMTVSGSANQIKADKEYMNSLPSALELP